MKKYIVEILTNANINDLVWRISNANINDSDYEARVTSVKEVQDD